MGFYSDLLSKFQGLKFSTSYILGHKEAVWVSTKEPEILLNSIPELNIVLSKRVELFNNGVLKFRTDAGDILDEHPAIDLLNNPNALQNRNDFFAMYLLNMDLHGNSFIYQNKGTLASLPNALWVLNSSDLQINITGKLYQQTELEGIIESYSFKDSKTTFETKDILHKTNGVATNYIKGISHLEALKMPISNIKASYKEDNVIRHNLGALGILSSDNKDAQGGIPLNQKEKEQVQDQYKDNFVGGVDGAKKSKVIITNSNLKWQSMSYPIKDLMIPENINQHFNRVIDVYGLHINLFSQTKGTTFENHKQTIIGVYQNTIQPLADDFTASLSEFLGLEGGRLIMDYSQLPVMQTNKKEEAETYKLNTETITSLLDRGLIDENEAKSLLNL